MINSVMSVEPLRIYMRKKLKLKLKEKSQMAVLESVFWEQRTVREDTGGLSGGSRQFGHHRQTVRQFKIRFHKFSEKLTEQPADRPHQVGGPSVPVRQKKIKPDSVLSSCLLKVLSFIYLSSLNLFGWIHSCELFIYGLC